MKTWRFLFFWKNYLDYRAPPRLIRYSSSDTSFFPTAREKPICGSKGEPDEIILRIMQSSSS
jgi:hypothetical protein